MHNLVSVLLPMTTKQLAQKWFDELWNNHNPAIIAQIMDASAVGVTEGGEIHGPDEFRKAVYEPLIQAFPDVGVAIDGMIAEGEEVAVRWTVAATHHGALGEVPASGKQVRFSGMTWFKFKNGKIVSGADSYNLHGLIAYLSGGPASATVRGA
jgi:steroid delta-isomerase-like uncharacterized protein